MNFNECSIPKDFVEFLIEQEKKSSIILRDADQYYRAALDTMKIIHSLPAWNSGITSMLTEPRHSSNDCKQQINKSKELWIKDENGIDNIHPSIRHLCNLRDKVKGNVCKHQHFRKAVLLRKHELDTVAFKDDEPFNSESKNQFGDLSTKRVNQSQLKKPSNIDLSSILEKLDVSELAKSLMNNRAESPQKVCTPEKQKGAFVDNFKSPKEKSIQTEKDTIERNSLGQQCCIESPQRQINEAARGDIKNHVSISNRFKVHRLKRRKDFQAAQQIQALFRGWTCRKRKIGAVIVTIASLLKRRKIYHIYVDDVWNSWKLYLARRKRIRKRITYRIEKAMAQHGKYTMYRHLVQRHFDVNFVSEWGKNEVSNVYLASRRKALVFTKLMIAVVPMKFNDDDRDELNQRNYH